MEEPKQSGPGFGGQGLIWLVLAAVGAFYIAHQPPLEGSRPLKQEPQLHDNRGLQDIEARLWQDPFAAVSKARDEHLKGRGQRPDPVPELSAKLAKDETLVIGVTVSGAPYPEDAEARRRFRYAVLAGLNVAKYVPEDEQHIGYFEVPADVRSNNRNNEKGATQVSADGGTSGSSEPAGARRDLPKVIPFEWFDARGSASVRPEHILVLWIAEDAISQALPLESLDRLTELLRSQGGKAPQFKIVGPGDSTTLRHMVKELRESPETKCGGVGTASKSFEFYDYGATVDDTRLGFGGAINVERLFKQHCRGFYRTISTDEALARVLVEELKRRHVNFGVGDAQAARLARDSVALISEWDTTYGQQLPSTFIDCVLDSAPAGSCKHAAGTPEWILRFSYLRGLDGQLPSTSSSAEDKPSEKPAREPESRKDDDVRSIFGAKGTERPEGQGQFDYLRRTGERVRQKDMELRQRGGRIGAVGVLGSDVYDKLVVMQEVRAQLPEALFFTTDLDTLYMHPSELRSTRNLLVASSFDLRLRDLAQGDIPPFRDSYQTAAFLATQLAIRSDRVDAEAADKKKQAPDNQAMIAAKLRDRWLSTPRLFQIERSGALSLPTATDYNNDPHENARCKVDFLECDEIHPLIKPLFPELPPSIRVAGADVAFPILASGIAILLAGATLAGSLLRTAWTQPVSRGPSAGQPFTRWRRGGVLLPPSVWLVLGVTPLIVTAEIWWPPFARWLTEDGLGEPMAVAEGISLWPTTLLRFASLVLSAGLVWHSWKRLDANLNQLVDYLRMRKALDRLIEREKENLAKSRWWDRAISVFSYRLVDRTALTQTGDSQLRDYEIAEFWRKYEYQGRGPARAVRVAVYFLMTLLLWVVLTAIFGSPYAPARGPLSHWVYSGVTVGASWAMVILIFFVADATLFCCFFVRELRQFHSVWPRETINQFKDRLGLERPFLDEWIDLRFIAKRTDCIGRLIYSPFLIIALFVVSRSNLFDAFGFSLPILAMQAISLAVVVGCAVALRSNAEASRENAKRRLTQQLIKAKATPGTEQLAQQLELMIRRVEELRQGAFTPFMQQPLIKAALLPLGSLGGTQLLGYLALGGL